MDAQFTLNRKKLIDTPAIVVLLSGNQYFTDQISTQLEDDFRFDYFILEHVSARVPKQFSKMQNEKIILADLTEESGNSPLLVSEIKSRIPYYPVIVLTDKEDLTTVKHSFLHGADGYLLKKDYSQKLGNYLQDYLKTRITPVSKAIIPKLVTIAQGKSLVGSKVMGLSAIQLNIAKLLVNGMSYQEAADILEINLNNLRYHIKQVYKKLDITRKMELVSIITAE